MRDGAKPHDAQAADDARDGITHVVRAAEHASNALPQTLLLDALGAPRPRYAHCSLVVDSGASRGVLARTPSTRTPRADGRKLSKRSSTTATVAALRNDGCTPLGVCAYLAGLGGRAPQSIESLDDLARSFELAGLSAAPSTFDRKQLDERDAAVAFSSRLGAAQLAVAVRARLSVHGSPAALDELAGEACAAFEEDKLHASGVVRALNEALTPDRDGMVEAAAAHGAIARHLVADRAALGAVVDAASWRAYADEAMEQLGLSKRGAFLAPARRLLTGRASGSDVGAQLGLASRAVRLGVAEAVDVEGRVGVLEGLL